MTWPAIWKLSLANMWRRKLRSILTILGMSVGIGSMVLLISFAAGLQKENERQLLSSSSLTQLTVSKQKNQGFNQGASSDAVKNFDRADLEKVRAMPHVLGAYPTIFLPPVKIELADKRYDAFVQPMPVEQITDNKKRELVAGSWWTKNSDLSIVLSESTLEQWKVAPADVVGRTVKVITQQFTPTGAKDGPTYEATVVGVVKKSSGFGFGNDAVAEDLAERMAKESPNLFGEAPAETESWGQVTVFVDHKDNVAAVRKSIEDAGWFASGLEELLKSINQAFLIMKIILGVIGGIALFVALIGITNSMLMAVLERTREIGIMSALGASRRTISGLFLAESGWLGLFGALLGLLGGYGIGQAIVAGINTYLSFSGNADEGLSSIKFYIGWTLAVGTLVGAVAVTLLAGWLPARRAAKLDPIKALRHE